MFRYDASACSVGCCLIGHSLVTALGWLAGFKTHSFPELFLIVVVKVIGLIIVQSSRSYSSSDSCFITSHWDGVA